MHILITLGIIVLVIWGIAYAIWGIAYAIFAILTYILFGLYVGLEFIATNLFVALDKIFYLGFDASPPVVWALWGFVIGAAILGYWEAKIYRRKGLTVLIALALVLLLVLVNLIKIGMIPI